MQIVFGFMFTTMSLTTITAITVDLHLAISKPFSHKKRTNSKIIEKVTVITWVLCVILSVVIGYIFPEFIKIYVLTWCVLYFMLISFILCVQRTIYKYIRRNENRQTCFKRSFKEITVIICAFILCFIPGIIAEVISNILSDMFVKNYILPWTHVFTFCNCVLDPIICIMGTPQLRNKISNFF
ncbi:lysophosphatidic acid receptor 3-like [Hydractinia symbiolongicarpus]|uniref:lysophosphatidic acid receptor 3-like n=1 Tax=Hydractinia symbiolongicarpus TaxID=13093 RepID=UPI002550AD5D|nr:lysophosphatidic acid receptor 3-like [Hydractinia symbiolongicarpus]